MQRYLGLSEIALATVRASRCNAAQGFTEAKLLELYPTHEDYVQKYTDAADKALASGYLLQQDYDESVQHAKVAPIPN